MASALLWALEQGLGGLHPRGQDRLDATYMLLAGVMQAAAKKLEKAAYYATTTLDRETSIDRPVCRSDGSFFRPSSPIAWSVAR